MKFSGLSFSGVSSFSGVLGVSGVSMIGFSSEALAQSKKDKENLIKKENEQKVAWNEYIRGKNPNAVIEPLVEQASETEAPIFCNNAFHEIDESTVTEEVHFLKHHPDGTPIEESEIIVSPTRPSKPEEFVVETRGMKIDPKEGYIDETSKKDLEIINKRMASGRPLSRNEMNSMLHTTSGISVKPKSIRPRGIVKLPPKDEGSEE